MSTRFYYGQKDYIEQLNNMDDIATASATSAKTLADAAAASATLAQNFAISTNNTFPGSNGYYGASKYATDAANSATAASGSVTTAQNWATSMTTFTGSGGLYGAKYYATDASNSAASAKNWATQSTTEVVAGQGYSAKQYATNASGSATLAQAWAAQASGTVDGTNYSAKYQAQAAAASATAAQSWATSMSIVSGGLYGAKYYADAASTSAGNASTYAGNANTSAGNANTSAGNAAGSATLAQKWATQVSGEVNGVGSGYSAYYWAQQAANSAASVAGQIPSDWNQTVTTAKDYIKNKPSLAAVATSGSYADLSNKPALTAVATSGNYNDLSNKPYLFPDAAVVSPRDFVNGTLVTTDLNHTDSVNPFLLTVTGSSYSSANPPFDLMLQGYPYNGGLVNQSAYSKGAWSSDIKVFANAAGKICFWWPRMGYWQGFTVHCAQIQGDTIPYNHVTGISDSAMPTGSAATKVVTITPMQALHSENFGSYSLPLTGGTVTGNIELATSALNFSGTGLAQINNYKSTDIEFVNRSGGAINFYTGNGNFTARLDTAGRLLLGNSVDNGSGALLQVAGAATFSGKVTTYTPTVKGAVTNLTDAPINVPQVVVDPSVPTFTPLAHQKTALNGMGYVQHLNIGSFRPGAGASWGGGMYVAVGGSDANPTEYFTLNYGGNIKHSSGTTFWHTGNLAAPSVSAVGNTLVQRDANGYIQGSWLNMGDNSSDAIGGGGNGSPVSAIIVKQGDNYYRGVGAAPIKTYLNYQGNQISTSTSLASSDIGVSQMMRWANYGNNHVIFDASSGVAPNGSAVNNTWPTTDWSPTYPNLMGWNGNSTYGVRVQRAGWAENLISGGMVYKPTIQGYIEKVQSASGTAFTVNPDNGTFVVINTTGNSTITLPTPVDGVSYTVLVAYGGAHSVTFNGGGTIRPAGGSMPPATSVSGKWDKYIMTCLSGVTMVQDGGRNF